MPIIVFGSSKGGCGKSTLATNAIAIDRHKGRNTLLIDADPQRSSSNWVALRASTEIAPEIVSIEKTGQDVKRAAMEMSKHYEHVFIDAPGHNSPELRASLVVADLLVYPVRPSNFDAWVFHQDYEDLISSVRTINEDLKVMVVMNGLSPAPAARAQEVKSLKDYLSAYQGLYASPNFVCQRSSFITAARDGRSVVEMAGKVDSLARAQLEVQGMYAEMLKVLAGERPEARQTGA